MLFEAIDRYVRGLGDVTGPEGAPGERPGVLSARQIHDPAETGPIHVTVAAEIAPYIPGYLSVTREQLLAGVAALEGGDCLPLRTLGHNLKGSGASFGLDEISRMGWRLERTAARGERALAREAARALNAYLARLEVS